jgi:hypothetical protein
MRAALPYLALVAIATGFINFFWSIGETTTIGDALNGYEQDGHYFVRLHGAYVEVSRATWEWIRVHSLSVFITHPLAMAGMAYMLFRFGFPMFMGGKTQGAATTARMEQIRTSGPVLATARCAGRIGEISVSGPLLEVSVLPAGIVIKPIFMPPRAIAASEIRRVVPHGGIFGSRLEIEHDGTDIGSPLILYVSAESSVGRAIRDLTSSAAEATRSLDPTAVRISSPFVTVLGIYGLITNLVIIAFGVFWAIPNLGAFGLLLTTIAIVIAVVNTRALLLRRRQEDSRPTRNDAR